MSPCGRRRCRHLSNNIMANYFDHLLSLDTPIYTVAQIAIRFEPSTELWAFHTIQPSSLFIKQFNNKNSSGDEIANVNFYAVRPEATRIR